VRGKRVDEGATDVLRHGRILLCFLFLRFFGRGRRGPWGPRRQAVPNARAILFERHARGEISVGEYRERLGNLD
jgi:uncharacterized membrane protein